MPCPKGLAIDEEIYSKAVAAFATATCPLLKEWTREEIYLRATSFEVATCQGGEKTSYRN